MCKNKVTWTIEENRVSAFVISNKKIFLGKEHIDCFRKALKYFNIKFVADSSSDEMYDIWEKLERGTIIGEIVNIPEISNKNLYMYYNNEDKEIIEKSFNINKDLLISDDEVYLI